MNRIKQKTIKAIEVKTEIKTFGNVQRKYIVRQLAYLNTGCLKSACEIGYRTSGGCTDSCYRMKFVFFDNFKKSNPKVSYKVSGGQFQYFRYYKNKICFFEGQCTRIFLGYPVATNKKEATSRNERAKRIFCTGQQTS